MAKVETVEIIYDDLKIEGYFGPMSMEDGLGDIYVDKEISFEYDCPKDYIVGFLDDNAYVLDIVDEDFPEDQIRSYIEQHFDELFEKHYDQIREYFRADAEAAAMDGYDYDPEPDYEDYDDDVPDDLDY